LVAKPRFSGLFGQQPHGTVHFLLADLAVVVGVDQRDELLGVFGAKHTVFAVFVEEVLREHRKNSRQDEGQENVSRPHPTDRKDQKFTPNYMFQKRLLRLRQLYGDVLRPNVQHDHDHAREQFGVVQGMRNVMQIFHIF
jgi:hypothetical protein